VGLIVIIAKDRRNGEREIKPTPGTQHLIPVTRHPLPDTLPDT